MKKIIVIRKNFKNLKIHVLLAALAVATATTTATATHLKIQLCPSFVHLCFLCFVIYGCCNPCYLQEDEEKKEPEPVKETGNKDSAIDVADTDDVEVIYSFIKSRVSVVDIP